MINCETEIKKYWDEEVKLLQKDVTTLTGHRDSNMNKLKQRLNKDNFPLYKEEINQGSYSMKTIIQHPKNDYDIDVGIVFREDDLKSKGKNDPLKIRKYIAELMKDERFNEQPECKKNCVRIHYNDGYHIDIPIYRESKNSSDETIQELASSMWEESDPKSINRWFENQKKEKIELKKLVQLMKKWARSRTNWNLPSGLILTILIDETYTSKDRLDETFYWTLKHLYQRLKTDKTVNNPTNDDEITSSEKHKKKVDNLYNRLDEMFDVNRSINLSELETTRDKKKALLIWKRFFNADFFVNQVKEIKEATITNTNQPWLKTI